VLGVRIDKFQFDVKARTFVGQIETTLLSVGRHQEYDAIGGCTVYYSAQRAWKQMARGVRGVSWRMNSVAFLGQ